MALRESLEEFLKSVRGVTCYQDRIRIYAPTCYGECIDAVNRLNEKVSKLLGGSTVYDAEGCWVNPRGETECEPVRVIESAYRCIDPETARGVVEAIAEYGVEAKQQALAVEQGSFYIASTSEVIEKIKELKFKLPY